MVMVYNYDSANINIFLLSCSREVKTLPFKEHSIQSWVKTYVLPLLSNDSICSGMVIFYS